MGGCPRGGGVAGIALGRGDDVFRGFAGSGRAVVTAGAGTYYRGVIHAGDGTPGAGGVASAAAVRAGDMIGALAGSGSAVVAAGT